MNLAPPNNKRQTVARFVGACGKCQGCRRYALVLVFFLLIINVDLQGSSIVWDGNGRKVDWIFNSSIFLGTWITMRVRVRVRRAGQDGQSSLNGCSYYVHKSRPWPCRRGDDIYLTKLAAQRRHSYIYTLPMWP